MATDIRVCLPMSLDYDYLSLNLTCDRLRGRFHNLSVKVEKIHLIINET